MLYVYVCDDESRWLARARAALEAYASASGTEMNVECFDSIDKLLNSAGRVPDVVFMDIEYDIADAEGISSDSVPSGINAVDEINRQYPECQVAYLTNHLGYALDVYGTRHVWYILKSQFEERLPEVFGKIMEIRNDRAAELVINSIDGTVARVPCRDIMYLERRDRRTIIVTHERKFEVKDRLPDVLAKLPAGSFARCHNSFAVNLSKVTEIHQGSLKLRSGVDIMISRGYSKSFRIEYMNRVQNMVVR